MLAWKAPQIKKNPGICPARVCSYGIAAIKLQTAPHNKPDSWTYRISTQWHRQKLTRLYLFALQPKSKHEPGVGVPQFIYQGVECSMALQGDPRHRGLSSHHKAHLGCGWSTGQAELHAATAALQSVTKTANLKPAQECTHKSQPSFCVGVVCVHCKSNYQTNTTDTRSFWSSLAFGKQTLEISLCLCTCKKKKNTV